MRIIRIDPGAGILGFGVIDFPRGKFKMVGGSCDDANFIHQLTKGLKIFSIA